MWLVIRDLFIGETLLKCRFYCNNSRSKSENAFQRLGWLKRSLSGLDLCVESTHSLYCDFFASTENFCFRFLATKHFMHNMSRNIGPNQISFRFVGWNIEKILIQCINKFVLTGFYLYGPMNKLTQKFNHVGSSHLSKYKT